MALNFPTCERTNRSARSPLVHIASACDHIEIDFHVDFRSCSSRTQMHLIGEELGSDVQRDDDNDCPQASARRARLVRRGAYSGFKLPSPFGGLRSRHFDYKGVTLSIHPEVQTGANGEQFHRAFVRATGDVCLRHQDVFAVIKGMRKDLRGLGAFLKSSSVRRLDVAIDLSGVPLSWFEQAKDRKQIKGRYRAMKRLEEIETNRGETLTGWRTSGNGLVVRVYDRLGKAAKSDETLVRMRETRWHGRTPKDAIRIEVQFRGARLRALGAVTFPAVAKSYRELARMILTCWIHIHVTQRKLDPVWQRMVKHLADQETGVAPLSEVGGQEIDLGKSIALARVFVGIARKLAILEGKDLRSVAELRTYALRRMDEAIDQNKSRIELRLKQQQQTVPR